MDAILRDSVIINYFRLLRARIGPYEADPKLVINANATLSGAISV